MGVSPTSGDGILDALRMARAQDGDDLRALSSRGWPIDYLVRLRLQGYSVSRLAELANYDAGAIRRLLRRQNLAD